MADEPQVIRGIDWKATFPFVSLFRGFRVAIHPSKLILALVALILIFFGGRILDAIWPASYRAVPNELEIYGRSQASVNAPAEFAQERAAAREAVVQAHQARLAQIPSTYSNRGSLSDYEWWVRQDLEKDVADIRTHTDQQITALDDAYNKRPADQKTEQARRDYESTRGGLELGRDSDIAGAYTAAADKVEKAEEISGLGLFDTFANYELGMLNQVVLGVRTGNWFGEAGVVDAIRSFFIFAPVWAVRHHYVFFTIFFLYFLCVWSIFGGAIARIAAVHVARDEKISIRQALRFSTNKFLSFLSAPIIPLLIVVAVGIVIGVGGLIANIPFLGPIVIGICFFLALVAGFVMTLVLLGTLGGFNLMYPTIAVEGSDSFDAISRSFSYLYARPWRMAFYTAVAILYGSICYLFVRYFVFLMLTLTHYFVGMWIFRHANNTALLWSTMWPSPSALGRFVYTINYWPLGVGEKVGAFLIMIWVYLAIGLLGAFAMSFYFSANTIIYFLMRHEVDATELDDVYLEQADDEFAEMAPATMTTTTVTTEAPVETTTTPADTSGNNGGATNTETTGETPTTEAPPT
jgi:hypothetical protein